MPRSIRLILWALASLLFVLGGGGEKLAEQVHFLLLLPQEEPGEMVDCMYALGGGMEGGHYRIELRQKPGQDLATLEISQANTWYEPERAQIYTVDPSAFRELEQIVKAYAMTRWDRLPQESLIALDADQASVYFEYEDQRRFSYSEMSLPARGWVAFQAIRDALQALAVNENSGLHLAEDAADEAFPRVGLSLRAAAYANGYLTLDLHNGYKVKDLTYSGVYRLFRQENGTWVEQAPQEELAPGEEQEIYAEDRYQIQFDLNVYGVLSPGAYRVEMDGIYTDFVLQ